MINSSATVVTLGGPRKLLTRSQRVPVLHAGKKAAAVVQSVGQPFPAGRHATSVTTTRDSRRNPLSVDDVIWQSGGVVTRGKLALAAAAFI